MNEVAPHVDLQLHEHATVALEVFVRTCIAKIERDIGRADSWTIKIVQDRVCYTCDVIVQQDEVTVSATGNGFEAAVAGHEAFERVETLLRHNRLARGSVPPW